MFKQTWINRAAAATFVAAALTFFALGADNGVEEAEGLNVRGERASAIEIISFGTTVGRFDTNNGAIHRLVGDPMKKSAKHRWVLAVPGVRGETSGHLEIQHATFNYPGATFLVDIETGATWLLKLSNTGGNEDATGRWDPIAISGS